MKTLFKVSRERKKLLTTLCSAATLAATLSGCDMPLPKPSAVANFSCGDLLQRYDQPIDGLMLHQCETGSGDVVADAVYRVTGNLALIEKHLIARYGMAPLEGDCCSWRPKGNGFGAIQTKKLKNELGADMALAVSLEGELEEGAMKAATVVKPALHNTTFHVIVTVMRLD